ncbi:MAG: sigma-70 family RNA polymerase sigma factor [Myxococcales bacterium]
MPETTFQAVFQAHAPFVWRVLRRYGVKPADLEDLCQEVFLVVFRKLSSFEGRSSVRTWLYEIARRTALAHRRGVRTRSEVETPALELSGNSRTPERELEDRRAMAWLEHTLAQLDEDKREAFVLHEIEGMTLAEVAAAVGAPVNTVHYRVHAARGLIQAASNRANLVRSGTFAPTRSDASDASRSCEPSKEMR